MSNGNFRAASYPLRLYSGENALENLPAELKRHRARRAFIVCGRTVSRKTALVSRLVTTLNGSCAGVFDELDKDTSLESVLRGTERARAAGADLLVGVGAGSVIQGTRVIAILLAESRPVEQLVTQYPAGAPAVSPRLEAPKLPIVNVLTAATSAQNRGGSGVKNPALDHRMEFFDPKTRPVAVFWDADALLTAPPAMARNTGCSVYWRAVINLGSSTMNPLVEGDRLQAFRLASRALLRMTDPADWRARVDMCAAAFLQNRDPDDGGALTENHWVARVVYAFATALFSLFPEVSQGEANTALTPAAMRELGERDPDAMVHIARALEAWHDGMPQAEAPPRAADFLQTRFHDLGMPTRLSELPIPRGELPRILQHSLKNFNADPQREFLRERGMLARVLDKAW
jgi:alcohol dehydrogenase class IV